jgi:NADH dehydrogenase
MRVAVLGAGYAGLTLARRLESQLPSDVALTVVNENPVHLVRHEVHRVIRRPGIGQVLQVPLTEVLDRAEIVVDRVESVDPATGEARLANGSVLSYDFGAVCLGSETAFHGLPGVREHATPLKNIADAEQIREEFLSVCEAGGRVVVGGAGLTGIQAAGELAALAAERDVEDVEILLLEQLDEVAPSFPRNFQAAARQELAARDVDIRTQTTIVRAWPDELELDDGTLAYDQLVWTGGIGGRSAMGNDRPLVRNDLRLTPSTFVLGDAARAVDVDGESVPASASAAIREARTVAGNIARLVDHERGGDGDFEPRMKPYRFTIPGWIVSVGDGAVAQLGPKVLTGGPAKAMKATVGAGHMGSIGAIRRAVELAEEELDA